MKNGLLSLAIIPALLISLNLDARDQKSSTDTAQRKMQVISGGSDQPPPVKAAARPAEKSKTPTKKSGSPTTVKSGGNPTTEKSSTTQTKSTAKSSKSKNAKNTKPKSANPFPGQYPEGSERILKEDDLEHLTPWGMKVMLNEIYARQGFIFKDQELKKHFSEEKWYVGKQASMSKIKLSTIEKQNVSFIKAHQGKAKI